jgi:hypothetical protein
MRRYSETQQILNPAERIGVGIVATSLAIYASVNLANTTSTKAEPNVQGVERAPVVDYDDCSRIEDVTILDYQGQYSLAMRAGKVVARCVDKPANP